MDETLRTLVRERAEHRCEYCHIHQDDDPVFRFHIDHIIPRKHGGSDDETNLALACRQCNLHKGQNITGIDPETGSVARLFHPRQDIWAEHFAIRAAHIIGWSPTGRVTTYVLAFNDEDRLDLRIQLGFTEGDA